MSSHDFDPVKPYFQLGTADESPGHLPVLEAISGELGLPKRPALLAVHGSILSEIADIYLLEETFDPEKATHVLGESDRNYSRILKYDAFQHVARRAVTFNSLRRARAADKVGPKLGRVLPKLASLGLELPHAPTFEEQKSSSTGAMSELIVLTFPLWQTIDRIQTMGDDEELAIAWPSYVRQESASGLKVEGRVQGAARNVNFNARLSMYDRGGWERTGDRRRLQVTSQVQHNSSRGPARASSYGYARGRTVIATRSLPGIETPDDMRSLFAAMQARPGALDQSRADRLRRTSQDLMRQATSSRR